MGIVFCDSFNSYGTTADMTKAWGSNTVPTGITFAPTEGPNGDGCFKSVASGGLLISRMYAQPAGSALGIRFKMKQSQNTSTYSFGQWNVIESSGNITSLSMGTTANTGTFWISRGGEAGTFVTSIINLCDSVWRLIEILIDLKSSGGAIKLWVDGNQEINFSGDTFVGTEHATQPWHQTFYLQGASVGNRWVKDFIMYDSSGIAGELRTQEAPFGPLKIATLRPNGAGSSTQFTPNIGANYAAVDEAVPDGIATYVQSATSGHRDLYTLQDLPETPSNIYGAVLGAVVDNPGAGNVQGKLTVKSGAVISAGTAFEAPYVSRVRRRMIGINPDGSIVWSAAAINALEIGHEVV